jgi:metal-responsive CopG/Arc/MetJ family transcriptional regulator
LNYDRRQLTVRLPHQLCEWLDQQAAERLLDRSTVITDLLVQAMRRSNADA